MMLTDENVKYYADNYAICYFHIQDDKKVYLSDGDKDDRKCRFCGKGKPDVKFKKDAHAISALVGNKTIFSLNECDTCNEKVFGAYEDSLSKFLGAGRTLMQTKGRTGVPSYKSKDEYARIDMMEQGLVIKEVIGHEEVTINHDAKQMEFTSTKQPYVPMSVYKAFVKMSISLMPTGVMPIFVDTCNWLINDTRPDSCNFEQASSYCIERFIPGQNPFKSVTAIGLIRKNEKALVPFFQFVLCFSNLAYQIIVPCPAMDRVLCDNTVNVCPFPLPFDYINWHYGQGSGRVLDLSSKETVREEPFRMNMGFEKCECGEGNGMKVDEFGDFIKTKEAEKGTPSSLSNIL